MWSISAGSWLGVWGSRGSGRRGLGTAGASPWSIGFGPAATGQWVVARRLLNPKTWIPATAVAMSIGLAVGAWAVGYGTSLGELALMGAITGIPIGAAQAYLLRDRVANAWVWAAAMPLLWALGWTVTTAGGIDVGRQFAVFGAFGAITFMALSGVLLDRLRATTPVAPAPQPDPSTATVQ